jgi:MarR family transcriptional regulator, organic hydroperoxide resistance regulator
VPRLAERRTAEIVLLDDALRFMRVVWNIQHALQSRSKRMERALGVTGPQRLAMRVVGTLPGMTPAELARVLHLDPSTISGVLQRLVSKRLMVRERDRIDRRVVRLRLTPAGDRLNRPSKIGTVESAIRATLGQLPEPKVRAAMDVLERLSQTLLAEP